MHALRIFIAVYKTRYHVRLALRNGRKNIPKSRETWHQFLHTQYGTSRGSRLHFYVNKISHASLKVRSHEIYVRGYTFAMRVTQEFRFSWVWRSNVNNARFHDSAKCNADKKEHNAEWAHRTQRRQWRRRRKKKRGLLFLRSSPLSLVLSRGYAPALTA